MARYYSPAGVTSPIHLRTYDAGSFYFRPYTLLGYVAIEQRSTYMGTGSAASGAYSCNRVFALLQKGKGSNAYYAEVRNGVLDRQLDRIAYASEVQSANLPSKLRDVMNHRQPTPAMALIALEQHKQRCASVTPGASGCIFGE